MPHHRGVPESHIEADYDLSVAAVAQRIGVAPATLRTWDRRYGLGPSSHTQGSHRRYSRQDVARLDVMKQLVLNGVNTAEAARLALLSNAATSTLIPSAPSVIRAVEPDIDSNVISMTSDKVSIKALTRAVDMLDGPSCEHIIGQLIAQHGVVHTWEKILIPLLHEIGMRWELNQIGVEEEHVISESLMSQFRIFAANRHTTINNRPVVLAAAPHELHILPLYAIAAALAEHGIATRVLGARLPAEALANVVRRLRPSAVLIWSQTKGTADLSIWEAIETQRPAPATLAAGPGWGQQIPEQYACGTTLSSTLVTLATAAGRI